MRIYLISDIHTEFGQDPMPVREEVDIVVLAGDIGLGLNCLEVAKFYRDQCAVPVIVLAGNHEYYGLDFHTTLAHLRAAAAALDGIQFLECEAFEWNDMRFLGCTLWTNFALYGASTAGFHSAMARQYVTDFRVIRCGKRRFTPADALDQFNTAYTWLGRELAKPFAGKTVVVTHFAPHHAAIHADFLGPPPNDVTPYFVSDCSDLMRRYPMAAWLYGHTHNSVDVMVEGRVRLISNQWGYPNERWTYTQFDPAKVVRI